MSTTTLFAEILVIGAGAALAGLLWAWVLLHGGPLPTLDGDLTPLVLAVLPFVYLLGLLVDRLADGLFGPVERAVGRRVYRVRSAAQFREAYYPDHRLVREQSGPLAAVLDYARSRIRICRGWCVNAAVLAGAVGLAMVRATVGTPLAWSLALGAAVTIAVVCAAVVVLDTREYVAKVKRQAAWVQQQTEAGGKKQKRTS